MQKHYIVQFNTFSILNTIILFFALKFLKINIPDNAKYWGSSTIFLTFTYSISRNIFSIEMSIDEIPWCYYYTSSTCVYSPWEKLKFCNIVNYILTIQNLFNTYGWETVYYELTHYNRFIHNAFDKGIYIRNVKEYDNLKKYLDSRKFKFKNQYFPKPEEIKIIYIRDDYRTFYYSIIYPLDTNQPNKIKTIKQFFQNPPLIDLQYSSDLKPINIY